MKDFGKCYLGYLFFDFLRFFGRYFDYGELGFSLRNRTFPITHKEELARSMNEDKYSSILFIEDPVQRCMFVACFRFLFYFIIL